jgi:glutaconate CoA-transferase subunit A
MPTTPVQGTGHFTQRTFLPDKFAVLDNPFGGGGPVCVVPPLKPALGIFHVHRVDKYGNAQMFGPTAEMRFGLAACQKLVVIAEEMVDTDLIRERPEATVAPGFMVDAIVIEPWAAHPTDSYGYYLRDLEHHELYGEMSKTAEGFERYRQDWILGPGDHSGFVKKLGPERVNALSVRGQKP